MSEHVITARATANEWGKRRWTVTCSCGWVAAGATKKEATALRVGTTSHLDHYQKPDCPTPHKKRFRSQQTAEKEMQLFWRTAGKGKTMPNRVYHCSCGGWHTTSKPARIRAGAQS